MQSKLIDDLLAVCSFDLAYQFSWLYTRNIWYSVCEILAAITQTLSINVWDLFQKTLSLFANFKHRYPSNIARVKAIKRQSWIFNFQD